MYALIYFLIPFEVVVVFFFLQNFYLFAHMRYWVLGEMDSLLLQKRGTSFFGLGIIS